MPRGTPRRGFKRSKYYMSEINWHMREIAKLMVKLGNKIQTVRRNGGRRG